MLKSDISAFDINAQTFYINEALDIIESNICFTTWKGQPQSDAKVKRWKRVWSYVREYFINTPILLPSGKITTMLGGIVSGSYLTQLVGSILNDLLLVSTAYYHKHLVINDNVLGDDGSLIIFGRPELEKWAATIQYAFRMTLSVTKSRIYNGDDPSKDFLGYKFKRMNLYRTDKELFLSALYPEGDVLTVGQSYSRLIAYMYLGGVFNTRFWKFFDFFGSGYNISSEEYFTADRDINTKAWVIS